MKNTSPIKLVMTLISVLATYNSYAATITVNGNIVAPSCTVNASSSNQTITLPTVGPSDLLNANNLSAVTFKFDLSGCYSSLSTAAVNVVGPDTSSDVPGFSSVLVNTGTATNVGIGIIGATSVGSFPTGPLPVGTLSATAPLTGTTSKTGTLYLKAQIVPLVQATTAVAGTVVGTATATFTYA